LVHPRPARGRTVDDIVRARLRAQRLVGEAFESPVGAVKWFGAVQSQDYPAAKWGLGQRVRRATDRDIDDAFNQGAILGTHVMRPTWHFVAREDLRWLIELTGARLHAGSAHRHRELEIDAATVKRSLAIFETELRDGIHLTRPELGEALRRGGISPAGQRLPHLLAAGEVLGVIASGPLRGKQFTYALIDERASRSGSLDRESALHELAMRYFRSHGPAQAQDFTWWSGLSAADARAAIAVTRVELEHATVDGVDYWSCGNAPARSTSAAHLLPNFDEFTVGYRDRRAIIDSAAFDPSLFSFGSVLSNVVTIDGLVKGAWQRTIEREFVRIQLRLPTKFTRAEMSLVRVAAQRYASFLRKRAHID
jgi:hypothetical protein